MKIQITAPSGNKLYYTGKAGAEYVSTDINSAFEFGDIRGAQIRAVQFASRLGSLYKVEVAA